MDNNLQYEAFKKHKTVRNLNLGGIITRYTLSRLKNIAQVVAKSTNIPNNRNIKITIQVYDIEPDLVKMIEISVTPYRFTPLSLEKAAYF